MELRRPLAGLVLVAVAYGVGLAVVYGLTVQTLPGRRLGDLSLRGAVLTDTIMAGTVDAVLDVVSAASLLGAMAVVATVALVRLARPRGLAAVGIMVTANATTWLLKDVVLSRPDFGLDEITPATLNSLPSGHSTAVFSAVAALAFVLPARVRPPVMLVGAGAATLTGLATMVAGWHRAGDSVAAFMVVGFWTTVAAVVVVVLGARPGYHPSSVGATVLRWPAVFAVGAVVLGSALALALDAAPLLRDSIAGTGVAMLAAILLVSGAASGAAVGILGSLFLMDSADPEPGAAL
jgi:membrane-associated phospholipid phosphatase